MMLSTIETRQDQLNQLFEEIFPEEMKRSREGPRQRPARPCSPEMQDDVLIQKAMQAKNGPEFKALWEGSTSSYGGDDSAADMAFANMLAFWTGGNAAQMERIFSLSGLGQRAKWTDRQDYRERTIQKAISGAREFYVPPVCTVEVGVPIHEPPLTRSRADLIEAETGVHIYNAEDDPKQGEISQEDLLKIKIPENPRFKTSLEPDNFIQEFIRYGETVTDSYPDYWFASGLYCISVAVNRNVVIKLRQGPIYPNVWVNILGLSSLARKSTAIDKADLTITAANIDPSCKMPDEFSPEAMIEMLDRQPRAYMIKDESAGLLAVMKKDYMRGLKDALMQLYDGKDINRELRTSRRKSDKTSFQVKNPYLNLMLATTPGSFAANTELLDVTSGWLPRFLHFFPNHAKDRWLPLEEGVPENDLLSAGCHARLIKIKDEFYDLAEPRVMHLSSDASAYFIAWQKARESELVEAKDDRKAQFYSRLAVYALKMGTLFTIGRADYKEGMEISLAHMQEACRLVDEYFMPMAMTVADLVGKAADKNQLDKIMAVLTARGGKLTKKDLMRATHFKKKDIEDSLETLVESNEIKLVTVSNPHGPASEWVIMSQDSDKLNTVDTVYTDIPSIQSHMKKINKDDAVEGLCDGIDGSTNATVCDEKPLGIDSSCKTKSETSIMDVEEGDHPSCGPHPRKDVLALKAIYQPSGAALEYAPFSLNLHNGCSHGCLYCYAKRHDPEHYHEKCEVRIKKSSLENIEADLQNWQGERKPIHLTFSGDLYDCGRVDNSIAREVLQLFRKYDHPFQVLTKGGKKAVQDFDLYGPNDRFGCTLTFTNDVDSLKWEPGAASPADRIEALRQAHERGIKTWASMEPVIDPAQTLALIEATHEFVDHYGVGKMNHNPEIEKNIDWPKFRADVEAMLKRYGKEYMIKAALAEASRGANHMPGDPAIRARLWDSIRSKMKKYARVDKERRGLAASDLSQEELELIKAAGWCPETTDQGITIFWAPEKSLKAMGLEALT